MMRLALAAWLDGNAPLAYESLVRAEAYVANGAPELGYLVLAVDNNSWSTPPPVTWNWPRCGGPRKC